MIDSEFVIKYTDALYTTPEEYQPRYDEFRDMFSSGQLRSKEWLVTELSRLNVIDRQRVIVVGSWFGTLGAMLLRQFTNIDLTLLDIDPRCKHFVNQMGYRGIVGDMYDYQFTEDVVINTSCEHIPDLSQWLQKVPAGTTMILQSNNGTEVAGHVNCASSIEQFKQQAGLSRILFSGELIFPMYTRYMIIGKL